jgi:hypothetical protein
MISRSLKTFAKILLKTELYQRFRTFINERDQIPQDLFLQKYKRKLEPVIDVEGYLGNLEIIDEQVLFLAFASHYRYIYSVDWSGEEYPGQIKRAIGNMLKLHFNIKAYKWKKVAINLQNIKRGDYLPLLFKVLNNDLEDNGFSVGFFDTGDDEYHYFLMKTEDFRIISELHDSNLKILDTKTYQLYLIGGYSPKILLYLKNKFAIPLNEIKSFIAKDDILVGSGNRNFIMHHEKLIHDMGGQTRILEIL